MDNTTEKTWQLTLRNVELQALAELLRSARPGTPPEMSVVDYVLRLNGDRLAAEAEALEDNIDMLDVVHRIHKMGFSATVEHTGGGCATIFAGPTIVDDFGDKRYAASAGPGSANGWKASTIEFFIGEDADTQDDNVKVTNPDAEEIAALIVDRIFTTIRKRNEVKT